MDSNVAAMIDRIYISVSAKQVDGRRSSLTASVREISEPSESLILIRENLNSISIELNICGLSYRRKTLATITTVTSQNLKR